MSGGENAPTCLTWQNPRVCRTGPPCKFCLGCLFTYSMRHPAEKWYRSGQSQAAETPAGEIEWTELDRRLGFKISPSGVLRHLLRSLCLR